MWDESRVRIIDIAGELGVSTATVSNVLHGKTKKISDATVRRVEQKLEERGYIPNMAATLLGRNSSHIIGVVIKNHPKYEGHLFEDAFVSSALNALADEIENRGYFMMLKKADEIMEIVRFASMWNLDGMVVLSFCEDEYQNLRDHIRIPFVTYDGFMKNATRISNVTLADQDGGRQAGEALKTLGHRKVLFIADNHICMDWDRYTGLCEGLGEQADFLEVPISQGDRMACYRQNREDILRHTAIFAASDEYALELMKWLIQRGIRVPEEISIAGFDGSLPGQKAISTLASVRQDPVLRAATAMDLLQRMITDPTFSQTVRLPVQWVPGESLGQARTSPQAFPRNSSFAIRGAD